MIGREGLSPGGDSSRVFTSLSWVNTEWMSRAKPEGDWTVSGVITDAKRQQKHQQITYIGSTGTQIFMDKQVQQIIKLPVFRKINQCPEESKRKLI